MCNTYEYVNHPSHYNQPGKKETIEVMRDKYGDKYVAIFCIITAFKYKDRAGFKPNEDTKRDVDKMNWYLNYAKSLLDNLNFLDRYEILDFIDQFDE